jgi:hypothetical protein
MPANLRVATRSHRTEARWLLQLASGDASQPPVGAEHLDGAAVLALAREHRLAAAAGHALDRHEISVAWQRELISAWRRTLADQLVFEAALEAIDRLLSDAALRAIALKGIDLAHRCYQPGERAFNDLDLLVRRTERDRVLTLLRDSGWIIDHPDPVAAQRAWFALTLRHPERQRVQLDLHWDLGATGRASWDLDAVFRRAQRDPRWHAIDRLAACDLIAHLALHAVSYHGASGRWIWWLDLVRLWRERPVQPDEWAEFDRIGAGISVLAAMHRCRRLFGSRAVPPAPRSSLRGWLIDRIGSASESAGGAQWRRWLVASLALQPCTRLVSIGFAKL